MTGTFQGVGTLQFTPDNKKCFAYSGLTDVDNNVTTLLNFTTTSEYLIGNIQNFYAGVSTGSQPNPNVQFQIKFNDTVIASYVTFDSATDNAVKNLIELVIPPFTNVIVTGINAETTATIQLLSKFTGNAQGSIEQFDLEVKE